MFEVGDIVRYIGDDRAELIGHTFLKDWYPLKQPPFLGVILNRELISPIRCLKSRVEHYQVRRIIYDAIHTEEGMYTFELEKVEY